MAKQRAPFPGMSQADLDAIGGSIDLNALADVPNPADLALADKPETELAADVDAESEWESGSAPEQEAQTENAPPPKPTQPDLEERLKSLQAAKDRELQAVRTQLAHAQAESEMHRLQALQNAAAQEFDPERKAEYLSEAKMLQRQASMSATEREMARLVHEAGLDPNDSNINYAAPSRDAFITSLVAARSTKVEERAKTAEQKLSSMEKNMDKLIEQKIARALMKQNGIPDLAAPSGGRADAGAHLQRLTRLANSGQISPAAFEQAVKKLGVL